MGSQVLDRSALDEAVRRFPGILRGYQDRDQRFPPYVLPVVVEIVGQEYRLILAERVKSQRKAA